MKNKYAPYILAPILILVWGLVFYRIYKAVYGEDETTILIQQTNQKIPKSNADATKYELSLNYADPFVSTYNNDFQPVEPQHTPSQKTNPHETIFPKIKNDNPPNNHTITNPKPLNPTPNIFPEITFQGVQIHQDDTVALVKLAGRFYPNVRAGQEIGKIKILSISTDELLIQFDQEQKIIKR